MLMSVFYLSADDLFPTVYPWEMISLYILCYRCVSQSLILYVRSCLLTDILLCFSITKCPTALTLKCTNRWVRILSLSAPPPPSRSFASFSCIITSAFLCPQSARKLWELFFKENLPSLLLLCQLWRTCRAVLCCGGVNRIHKQNSFLHHRQMRILCPSLLPIINPRLLFPPSVLSILSLSPYFSIPSSFFFFIFSLQFMSYCIFLMLPALNLHFFTISVALPFDWFLFLFISLFSVHPVSTSVSF